MPNEHEILREFTTMRPGKERDYICKDRGLHDYSNLVGEDEHVLVERCVNCGHEITFVKSEQGRIDNMRYGESHMMWFLQPKHPLYERYYGKPRPPLPSKAQKRKQAVEQAKEEFRKAAFESAHGNN